MSSLLSVVFACCLRSKSQSRDRPDETTHLIPSAADVSPPPKRHVVVVDPQRMKERLGTIVRSKEGKMVNVNSQVPFNLHSPYSQGQASTSRSTRYPSPQRSIQTSPSTTSLQQSYIQLDNGDGESGMPGEEDGMMRNTLNVRLVKTAGGTVNRGRPGSRSRLGRFGEEKRVEGPGADESEAASGREEGPRRQMSTVESEGAQDEGTGLSRNSSPRDEDSEGASASDANAPIPVPRKDFKIQSTSALARSWGD